MAQAPKMTAQDRKWQAESDAQTLASAHEIANTPTRIRAAKDAAKRLAATEEKRLAGLRKVAKIGATPQRRPRGSSNPPPLRY